MTETERIRTLRDVTHLLQNAAASWQGVNDDIRGAFLAFAGGLDHELNRLGRDRSTTQSAWKPIESAPRDGTAILVYWHSPHVEEHTVCDVNCAVSAWWSEEGENGEWICYMDMPEDPTLHFDPTHWMPLPPPPEQEAALTRLQARGQEYDNAAESGDGS